MFVKLKPASDSVAELSLEDVLTHVARAQEMQFFFRCVSLAYGKQMNGANTPMPLQWDDRSPAEVATQIVVKHGFAADTWSTRKVVAECLMREWEGAPEVLVV